MILSSEYGNEETDEARTNEEEGVNGYEEVQN
jgi:hypothetical protein